MNAKQSRNVGTPEVPIYDIREAEPGEVLFDSFVNPESTVGGGTGGLVQPDGTVKARHLGEKFRKVPNEIRYDARGLELHDKILELEVYYGARCEREILHDRITEIVKFIPDNASIVELGCGSLTKTGTILDRLRKEGRSGVKFFALDIEKDFLETSLTALVQDQEKQSVQTGSKVEYAGLYGSYTDALSGFLKNLGGPRVLLWLGTTLGNCTRSEASALLERFQKEGMEEGDVFFIGIDKRKDPLVVAAAYVDAEGLNAEFGMNGLDHLNDILGTPTFDRSLFEHFSGYNDAEGQIESYFRCLEAHTISVPCSEGRVAVALKKDELIRHSVSVKYSMDELEKLGAQTGLHLEKSWTDSRGMYAFCMFRKPHSDKAVQ
ncbi:hypothetical protein BSKO_05818 [Bryopsis sp. KO-2023]|nr:hypothetical protein BSKO_05818 [Bryopsis sp. KO-2023]